MSASESKQLKSRKERRKEARLAKHQQRLQSWVLHQASQRNAARKGTDRRARITTVQAQDFEQQAKPSRAVSKDSYERAKGHKKQKDKEGGRKRPRTKFEEYLEMENRKTTVSTEDDLALERKLAKKLKVKKGSLRGPSDGLSELLEGMVPSLGSLEDGANDHEVSTGKLRNKRAEDVEDTLVSAKRQKSNKGVLMDLTPGNDSLNEFISEEGDESEIVSSSAEEASEGIAQVSSGEEREAEGSIDSMDQIEEPSDEDGEELESQSEAMATREDCQISVHSADNGNGEGASSKSSAAKYVAPHLRGSLGSESNEVTQLQRRIRGLLNRLSEANVESVAMEFSSLFQAHGRRLVTENITNEILGALCSGPRGNDQYAAVFAAFVAGISSLVGMDFGAKFIASLADIFEDQYQRGDSLALRNLTLLLSYLYNFKLLASDLVYDLICLLCKRLEELDVATILTILQSCGMGLRVDDPVAMKEFVFDVQRRTQDLKAAVGGCEDGATVFGGKRMQYMLETICEIKNNKRRPKLESAPHLRLRKWLQKLRVEEVQLRSLSWKKLLDPAKRGQWWLSGGANEEKENHAIEVADFMDKEVAEAEKMLQLASSQRMNTGTRRAVFCIIMSGEDYLDAFEKILRLKLSGKQDRDVLRVVVECCLQERVFNKYYSLLAAKLCHHDKNHKFTLQYCLWDHFKLLNSMETRRIANLAHLLADLIGTYSLSLAVLKAVDFSNMKTMTPKVVLHFRIFLEVLLTEYTDEIVWNVFSRIANAHELESLRIGVSVFLHQHLKKTAQADGFHTSQERPLLVQRCHLAKRAMANTAGVLLK